MPHNELDHLIPGSFDGLMLKEQPSPWSIEESIPLK